MFNPLKMYFIFRAFLLNLTQSELLKTYSFVEVTDSNIFLQYLLFYFTNQSISQSISHLL